MTCGAFLSRLAGRLTVVEAKVVVGEDGRMSCGWLTCIPSSSGISPVCSKAVVNTLSWHLVKWDWMSEHVTYFFWSFGCQLHIRQSSSSDSSEVSVLLISEW